MASDDPLIYDIGMHRGEDTDFYLKLGYRVIAIEADPNLAEYGRRRFAKPIADGRLQILEGAVAPAGAGDRTRFFVNEKVSVWGTIDRDWVARNQARGCPSREIEVDLIDMDEVFRGFGAPHFLKIDIEGADGLVLAALRRGSERPRFVSIEANTVNIPALMQDLDSLCALGYRRFQLAPQQDIHGRRVEVKGLRGEAVAHIFEEGASGVFGDDLPGAWTDREGIAAAFSGDFDEWQDVHARL